MDTLLTQIDNLKTKLTDQEYINLMNSLKKVNEEKEKSGLYELTLVVIKARPSEENDIDSDIMARIYPVVEKRIYKADDFNYSGEEDIMKLKNHYLRMNFRAGNKIESNRDFCYYDSNCSFDKIIFREYLCIDVKKL